MKLYLIHQFTSFGAPHIWNGDEMGMWGADDPDCRKPLWWPELDFEPEYRNNFRPVKKEFDEVGFNREHFEFYQKLIRIRKENPALVDGKLNFLAADKKWLVYERVLGDQQIIVVFNLGEEARKFIFSRNSNYINLLDGSVAGAPQIQIQPLGAGVLRRGGRVGRTEPGQGTNYNLTNSEAV